MIPYDNFESGVLILLVIVIFYYSTMYRFYRTKYEKTKVKQRTSRERTELESKRFMKNSKDNWGVIK